MFSVAFLVAGAAGITIAFSRSWEGSLAELAPGARAMAAAGALLMAGLLGLAWSWVAVVGADGDRPVLVRAFLLSQLGKYVPGGVWQAAGQVAFSLHTGLPGSLLWRRLVGFILVLVVSPTPVVALGALQVSTDPSWVRLLMVASMAALAVVHPAVLDRIGRLAARASRRRLIFDDLWPPGSLRRAMPLAAFGATTYGAGFAVLLDGIDPATPLAAATAAFVAAWLAGLLAVPVPAGVGVREAALVLLLSADVPVAAILAASVGYRVLGMAGEVTLAIGSSVVVRVRARRIVDEAWRQPERAPGPTTGR